MSRLQASLEKRGVKSHAPASLTRMKIDKPAKGRKTTTSPAKRTVEVAGDVTLARARKPAKKTTRKSSRGRSKVA